nr:PREDICTED: ras association domain-containing protein 1-like [Lepisosteus oculatus]
MRDGSGEEQQPQQPQQLTASFEMTWGSTASSGYCSQEDSDSELEQYFTARTSFARKPRREKVSPRAARAALPRRGFSFCSTWGENKINTSSDPDTSSPLHFFNKDGSYTGFIKVQFKLVRPVSVPPPRKGAAGQDPRKGAGVKRRTSFYLPRDTAKHLHISSRTRAREVIEALLNKFTVVDNPRKFALFERTERHDQGERPARCPLPVACPTRSLDAP